MSDSNDTLQALADEYDVDTDPLRKHNERFQRLGIDPFEPVIGHWIKPDDPAESTLQNYRQTYRQWSEFMQDKGRHPALPNENHVEEFLRNEVSPDERDNSARTAVHKYNKLRKAMQYWQSRNEFPHNADYEPFKDGRERVNLQFQQNKPHEMPPLQQLRGWIDVVKNIRCLAFITANFKLGVRSGELQNMQLQDINIPVPELQDHYEDLGTHQMIEDKPNAIVIPPRDDPSIPVEGREGNKSKRPRVIPLDDELRAVLIRYLLIRPDVEHDEVFLTEKTHSPLDHAKTINKAWRDALPQAFLNATEDYRKKTSHYGRHWFSNYWTNQNMPREQINYLRGDTPGTDTVPGKEAIDHYIHTKYDDIENTYRDDIFKFGISL